MNNRYYNLVNNPAPGPGQQPGQQQQGGGGSFTANPNNANGLTAGPMPGTGTGCGCSYDMNCWSQTSPSNLTTHTNQPTQTCPQYTQLTEPPITYSGTCYQSGCPVQGVSYNNLPSAACPGGEQPTAPTCNPSNCFKCNGNQVVSCTGGPFYNGQCPPGCQTQMPNCNIVRSFDGQTYYNAEGGGKARYVCDGCPGAGDLCNPSENDCPENCTCKKANVVIATDRVAQTDRNFEVGFTGQGNGDYLYSNWDFDGGFNPVENY